MPAELTNATGDLIRERGREWGVNTGRPRRVGWFDAVAGRQTRRLNGVTHLAVTLLDVLDVFEKISLCTAYQAGGRQITHVPALLDELDGATPVLRSYPGWSTDTTACGSFADLPPLALSYLGQIETHLGARVRYVGVGPDREQLIDRGA